MDAPDQSGQAVIDLLKTARGQVDATLRMAEENRNSIDVSRQVLASIALLKKANLVMLKRLMNTWREEANREDAGAEKVGDISMIIETYLKG